VKVIELDTGVPLGI